MIHTLIMAGGSGTRFWPKSRKSHPKQFLSLASERPLLRETVERAAAISSSENTWVITNRLQGEKSAEILSELDRSNIIEEPFGRDTAACIGLAALVIDHRDPEAEMLIMPADHMIHPIGKCT